MKKWLILLAVAAAAAFTVYQAQAATPLKGRLLLQVQSHGEIWYADANDGMRYLVPKGAEQALNMLSMRATLIDQRILEKIPTADSKATGDMNARRLYSGHILLSDGDLTRIWYVSPKDMRRYWFDGTDKSFGFFKKLAAGVLDKDLKALREGEVKLPEQATTTPSAMETMPTASTTTAPMPATTSNAVTSVKITTSTSMLNNTITESATAEVVFSQPVTNVVWYGFDTTPSSTQVWTQAYPFQYEDGQTTFTLGGTSNLESGMGYTYMIMAQDKATGLPIRYDGKLQ